MSKLTVVFNDISSGGQSNFPLYAIPGDVLLPFINGALVNNYTVSGSVFSLPAPLEAGNSVVIYSTQGGSVTSETRLNELLAVKANSADILAELTTKVDKSGGTMAGRITLAHDPIGPMEPVTLGYLQSLPFQGLVWSDIEAILNDKASKGYVDAAIGSIIPKTEKGQPGGVASLNASGQIHSGQLYAGIFTNVFTVASDAEMLATGASVGDFVLRTDVPRKTYIKADAGADLASFREVASWDSGDISYVPQNLLTQTNVQGAMAEMEGKVSSLSGGNAGHITDYNNPHAVTHAQVGPEAANSAAPDATRNKHLSNNDIGKLEGIEVGATADQTATEIIEATNLALNTFAPTTVSGAYPHGESTMLVSSAGWPGGVGTITTVKANSNNTHQYFKDRDSGWVYFRDWNHVAIAWSPWYINDNVPIGTVHQYAGVGDPSSIYLVCDGRALNRTTYAALYSVVGTRYGAGDGTTTFNIPDCRGRAPIGAGQGTGLSNRSLAAKAGSESHVLTGHQMPSHGHGASATESNPAGTHSHSTYGHYQANTTTGGTAGRINHLYGPGQWSGHSGGLGSTNNSNVPANHSHSITIDASGGGGAHNNMQPSIALNMIIKVVQ